MEQDPRFVRIREAIEAGGDPAAPTRDAELDAAVAVVLRGGAEVDVLLIKRAQHDPDPWSGHMALPGGRQESGDTSLLDTAVRETREETGIDLGGPATVLGRLRPVHPGTRRLPDLSITPFVVAVPPSTQASAASYEVERVHWVPLERLRAPETRGTVDVDLPDGARTFECLRVEGEIVWGLTLRILDDFLERVADIPVG